MKKLVILAVVVLSGCGFSVPRGTDKPVVLAKRTELFGESVKTEGIFFTQFVDNMLVCKLTAKKFREDPSLGGDPAYVKWYCRYY